MTAMNLQKYSGQFFREWVIFLDFFDFLIFSIS